MSVLESDNNKLNGHLEEIKEKNILLEIQVQEIPRLKLKVNMSVVFFVVSLIIGT